MHDLHAEVADSMGVKLTPEERKQRKAERDAEREEHFRRFPRGSISSYGDAGDVRVLVEAGSAYWMRVEWRGEGTPMYPDEASDWRTLSINISDPEVLARFIVALVARYNATVQRINASTKKAEMTAALKMQDDA